MTSLEQMTMLQPSIPWSLHKLSDDCIWSTKLFVTQLFLAGCLICSVFPRISSFALWVIYRSELERMPLASCGGDPLLKISLLWFTFLPSSKVGHPESLLNVGAIGLRIQVLWLNQTNS